MANKVEVEVGVAGEERARAAYKALRAESEGFVEATNKAGAKDPFEEVTKGAERAGRAADEMERAIEDSFRATRRLGSDPSEQIARSIQTAQREALTLQRSFQQLRASPFKNIADESERAAAHSFQLQRTLASLYQQQGRGRPLAEIDRELGEVNLKAERLRQQLFRLQSAQVANTEPAAGQGPGISSFALRRVITTGAQAAGLPGEVGAIGGLEAFGGVAAGAGGILAVVAAERELVKLSAQYQRSQLDLAVAARDSGRGFAEARADADAFRASLIANREEAERVAAAFGELKLRTGDALPPEAAERLSTIATARGLDPEQTAQAIKGLASGSKEAFEAFTGLRADVVLDRYAKSLGVLPSRLNEVQRAQALTNAALQQSGGFADLAARRTQSLDARYKSLLNTAKDLGVVTANLFVGTSLNDPQFMGEVGRRLLGRPPVTPEETPAERAAAEERRRQEEEANRQQELRARTQTFFQNFSYESARDRLSPEERLRAAQGQQEQFLRAFEQFSAEDQEAFRRQYFELVQGLRSQLAERHITDALGQIGREDNLIARVEGLRRLRREVQGFGEDGALSVDQVSDRLRSLDEQLYQTQKQLSQTARAGRDEVRNFLAEVSSRTDSNPFVALFERAATASERARQRFGLFGREFAEQMATIERQSIRAEIATARFHAQLSGLRSEQEARRLELPQVGPTGAEERNFAVVNAQLAALQQDPGLARRQAFLENPYRPFTPLDAARQAQGTLDQVLALDVSGAGRAGREAQAQAVLSLLNQFDPRTVATSPLAFFRSLRGAGIDAYRTQREALTANVQDALERERAGAVIQEQARELARTVAGARDVTRDERLKELLAVTGQLSDKELTPDLRRARIDALRESARADAGREEAAEKRAKALDTFINNINRMLEGKGIKVDAPASNVTLNVSDGLNVATTNLLGTMPQPEVTYQPGVRTIGGGL